MLATIDFIVEHLQKHAEYAKCPVLFFGLFWFFFFFYSVYLFFCCCLVGFGLVLVLLVGVFVGFLVCLNLACKLTLRK